MAHLLCSVALGREAGRSLATRLLAPPVAASFIPTRGKKQAKKQPKTKKMGKKEMMKDFLIRRELEKMTQEAVLKAAKKGEALDTEMLNPARKRPPPSLSEEEKERRCLLVKEWSRFCMEKHKQDLKYLHNLVQSREKALRELKKVSLPLYSKALELNPKLFPFDQQGPTATPPLPGYIPPEPADS